jgi:predicted DNA binding CopG/RHH family protein
MKKSKRSKKIINTKDPLSKDLFAMIERSELIPASRLFDYLPKYKTISLRLSESLLESIKRKTTAKNNQ